MPLEKGLYVLTVVGLYLELGGALLLSAEAIGAEHLLRVAQNLRRRRVATFLVYIVVTMSLLLVAKLSPLLRFVDILVLVLSLGLFIDFGPRLLRSVVSRMEKGRAGIIGFLLFAAGFAMQSYVTLSLLP